MTALEGGNVALSETYNYNQIIDMLKEWKYVCACGGVVSFSESFGVVF